MAVLGRHQPRVQHRARDARRHRRIYAMNSIPWTEKEQGWWTAQLRREGGAVGAPQQSLVFVVLAVLLVLVLVVDLLGVLLLVVPVRYRFEFIKPRV